MHEMNLPDHWKVARLGKITEIIKGGTPSRSVERYFQGDIAWAIPSDITALDSALYIHDTASHISEEGLSKSAAKLLPSGTVLLTSRATIGETAISTLPMATNQGFSNFICNDEILNVYLAYYLRHIKKKLNVLASGSTFKEVTKGTLLNVEIPLPPLPEQRAIAHVLQTIQEAKFTRQREIALERERKAALMDYLFSHGTKDEPHKQMEIGEIPESWEVVRLGDIADITYGVQAAVAHLLDESVGLPILTNINITLDGTFDLSTLRYYDLPQGKRDKLILKKGDLLFNWRSGSQHHVGKTVLFDLNGEYTFSSFILRFRFAEKVKNVFAFHYFHYLREKGFFALKRSQSSVNSVFNASKSAEIPVVMPSVEEQSRIGDVLQASNTKIATLEQEVQRLDELFHAMLEELMTGQRSAVPLIDTELAS